MGIENIGSVEQKWDCDISWWKEEVVFRDLVQRQNWWLQIFRVFSVFLKVEICNFLQLVVKGVFQRVEFGVYIGISGFFFSYFIMVIYDYVNLIIFLI